MSLNKEAPTSQRGVHIFATSTARDLLVGPERALAITNIVNRDRDPQDWVGVEVYSTMPLKPLLLMRRLSERLGLPNLVPPYVTPESIQELQAEKYPHTKVTAIHGPFNGTWPETFHRMTIGEFKNGPMQMFYQIAWAFLFGPPALASAIHLAEELKTPLNLHANVANDLIRTGGITKLEEKGIEIWLENERKYHSFLMARELTHDPRAIAQHFIKEKRVGQGLTLGLDHTREQNALLEDYLKDPLVRKYAKSMHLAQVGIRHLGQVGHGLIQIGEEFDSGMQELLKVIGNTEFTHSVRATFNFVTSFSQKKSVEDEAEALKYMITAVLARQHPMLRG